MEVLMSFLKVKNIVFHFQMMLRFDLEMGILPLMGEKEEKLIR